MEKLLTKLNYKGDDRICILNGDKSFLKAISGSAKNIRVDKEIDPRFLYNFLIIFSTTREDVESTFPRAVHNLYEDGIVWFIYPKDAPEDSENALTRKKGWSICKESGFEAVRHVCVDDKLSATRFRNKRFIKRRNKD